MKKSVNLQSALSGMRSNMMSYALILTSSRPAANRLVNEVAAQALTTGVSADDSKDLKGMIFSMMRDIYVANYRGLVSTNISINDNALVKKYHIEVPVAGGLESVKGVMSVDDLTEGIDRLQPRARRVFSMYATGYTMSEIRAELGMKVSSILNHLINSLTAIF